ncbi:MAG: hypothetical protein CMF52_05005 [Legionellales bacterium]|nr:hypothetical protein [Legionellales bacterium]HAV93688.1 hypothetical protein [Pseudomonadota bacterium]
MLRKLLFIAFAIILFGFLAKTYHLEDAQIIILSQQVKISINFIIGILMVIVVFAVIHYLLRMYQFIRSSPSHWKKYRHDKTINKRQKAIDKALLHQVNDQFDQAVYQFHEASLLDDPKPISEQLSAINNLILAGNIETAQTDLTEVATRDPKQKAAALYLQAKIFHKKGQPISAVTSIKQIKGFEQSPQATKLLVSCYDQGKQYQELLQFLSQRSVLPTTEKKQLTCEAHTKIIEEAIEKNQVADGIRYYQKISSYYNKAPNVLTAYASCLCLSQNNKELNKLLDRHLDQLITNDNRAIIDVIDAIDQKDLLNQLETKCDQYLKGASDKLVALQCRAIIHTKKEHYEKAIQDYISIISLGTTPQEVTQLRLKIAALEKFK